MGVIRSNPSGTPKSETHSTKEFRVCCGMPMLGKTLTYSRHCFRDVAVEAALKVSARMVAVELIEPGPLCSPGFLKMQNHWSVCKTTGFLPISWFLHER